MIMGCTPSKVKDSEEQHEVLDVCSSTPYSGGRFDGYRRDSESISSNSSSEHTRSDDEFGTYSSMEFSSNESFSMPNEPQFETEGEISEIYSCVHDGCENEAMCWFLNRFQDSEDTYQQLHWQRLHTSLPGIQKPLKSIAQELKDLPEFSWYWGPMSSNEANQQLEGQPDGSFLVRDSANSRHLLSVSFRSKGSCCHTRIQCRNKKFSLVDEEKDSVIELLQQAMVKSKEGVLFYSRRKMLQDIWYPVRLLYPVSRMTKVPSLQFLCRFVIRRNIRCDKLNELPLPKRVIKFLHGNYFRDTV